MPAGHSIGAASLAARVDASATWFRELSSPGAAYSWPSPSALQSSSVGPAWFMV